LPGGRRGGTARGLDMIFGAAVVNAALRAEQGHLASQPLQPSN
jgi:hypothetical protein